MVLIFGFHNPHLWKAICGLP